MSEPNDPTRGMDDAVCIHVARAECESIVRVTFQAGPAFVNIDEALTVRVCGLCFGWFHAVVRFGLPVKR